MMWRDVTMKERFCYILTYNPIEQIELHLLLYMVSYSRKLNQLFINFKNKYIMVCSPKCPCERKVNIKRWKNCRINIVFIRINVHSPQIKYIKFNHRKLFSKLTSAKLVRTQIRVA